MITGSDQVWNPQIVGGLSEIYTLNFGGNEIKRISYAASVGDVNVISDNKEEFSKKLSNLNYISVRENDAKDELQKIINKDIEVVLDPTLLMSREEWNSEIISVNKCNQKYIVAYVVEPDTEYKVFVDGTNIGKMKSNLAGKISVSIEVEPEKQYKIQVVKL